MKVLLITLIYIVIATAIFTILSGIAYLFTDYTFSECTHSGVWQFFYVVLHWCLCIPIVMDIDENYIKSTLNY